MMLIKQSYLPCRWFRDVLPHPFSVHFRSHVFSLGKQGNIKPTTQHTNFSDKTFPFEVEASSLSHIAFAASFSSSSFS